MKTPLVCHHGPLEIRFSALDRFGVFATAPIAVDELIHEAPVLVLERDWESVPSVINHYLFAWPKQGDGRAIGFGLASLLNHSANPNARWETITEREVLAFHATRPIAAGEEILIDYGAEYWPNHHQYPHRYPCSSDQQPPLDRSTRLTWH